MFPKQISGTSSAQVEVVKYPSQPQQGQKAKPWSHILPHMMLQSAPQSGQSCCGHAASIIFQAPGT